MAAKSTRKLSTFGSRLTSTVSVGLVLVLLGLAAMLALTAHNVGAGMRSGLALTVRMTRTATADIAEAIGRRLGADRGVQSVLFISADSILAAETAAMGGALALEDGVNPYGAEFEVRMRPEYAHADSIAAFEAVYAYAEGVEEISTQTAVLEALEDTMNKVRTALLLLGAILLIVSIVLINNTVSLSIYSRRFSIHTMRLVGATAGFIRAPFVRAGAVAGMLAGLGAAALLCGLRAWSTGWDPVIDAALPWYGMAVICSAMVIAGTALCALTSYFATNRYLARSYDEMFLK